MAVSETTEYVRWFDELESGDVAVVGGKNASLGEMFSKLQEAGLRVPDGFATTAAAYRQYIEANELGEFIRDQLAGLSDKEADLADVGQAIRDAITDGEFPDQSATAIREAYVRLCERRGESDLSVAARSSATAEDLPEASFAGQQETYLNVRGADDLLVACRRCYASLFTDRAISYREEQGFDHMDVALSVGVQQMVRCDEGSAGVLFTIDTQTGFPDVVVINSAWGLGESVVGGTVTPDEFAVFKPLLSEEGLRPIIRRSIGTKETKIVYAEGDEPTKEVSTDEDERTRASLQDEDVLTLARWGLAIERHYDRPMDVEWAKDGRTGELFILQARPETVQSRKTASSLKSYTLLEEGTPLVEGLAVGNGVAVGPVFVLMSMDQADRFEDDGVLVTDMTDPDWVPIMRRASAIVTDQGGRTSHAAIVSRELGVPAVIGAENATSELSDGQTVTVSCAEGATGYVYEGELEFEQTEIDAGDVAETETQVMINMASPDAAFRWWNLPVDGVGLARMEFLINNVIKVHPLALTRFDELEDEDVKERVAELTAGFDDRAEYFVEHLARGMARIAAPHYPHPVIVRLSDFKTNEYADLVGGRQFEPQEENPMLGFRGAARYYSDRYRDGFALECRALLRAREEIGLTNIIAMVPFCRTLEEADRVLQVMADNGLIRGRNGFQVYVMAEVPSNVILAEQFADRFDGFSVGSNDLTQLVLGVDRDAEELSELFDERDEAVKEMIRLLIERAHAARKKVGICGQAPSDHPEFAGFLVGAGIDAISVNPDSVVEVRRRVAEAERQRSGQ